MPWTYVWKVKPADKEHEVRLELGILGRERLIVDGVAVSDGYSWKMRRRHPVPIGAGHSAGLEVSMAKLWPETQLSVDGQAIEPTSKPRVPLWGWALALFSAVLAFMPLLTGPNPTGLDLKKSATRGLLAGFAVGGCLWSSAGSSQIQGLIVSALLTAGAWALYLQFLR